jgi:nicotinate phosphoribosyltransferase
VGTSLVTGSGHPTCGFVYKLVARENGAGEMVGVAKRSKDKTSIGGRKYALRRRDRNGVAEAEVVGVGEAPHLDGDPSTRLGPNERPLLVPLVAGGDVVGREGLAEARDRHEASRAELPIRARQLSRGEPVLPTEHVGPTQT